MRWRALLLAGAALAAARPAPAQLPAGGRWLTIESANFRVTYTPPLEPLARHAAAAAERAHAALRGYVETTPRGRIDVVLSDNVDLTNGSATPFPGNTIYLYAKPPADLAELNYVEDWIELVVIHELAHVFHLDATSRFGHALRGLFGRVPFDWPFFPALANPAWSIEGLAVAAESELTSLGRLHGTFFDMIARTAALEEEIEDMDRLGSQSPLWPGGQRAYIYGSLFMRELVQRFGSDAMARVVGRTASAVIPPSLWYDPVARRAFGAGFRSVYEAWRTQATLAYRARADTLRAEGLTTSTVLVREGGVAAYPRFARDGRSVAYAANDRRGTPVLRVIDVASGAERWAQRLNGANGASWLDGEALIVPQLEFRDPEHLYFDLYRFDARGTERLTQGARLQDVDATADGTRLVAVQNESGTNRLVVLAGEGREARPLTPLDPGVHWSRPRWSPAGDRIAVSRWSRGGRYDVVVLDTAGAVVLEVTHGIGVNADPAWTPDGRFIVFSSDRTGIANLYAYELANGALHQVTNLLGGAASPDVAPDGRTLAFSAYHRDGWAIELVPFDPAALRPPQPARLPQLPLPPGRAALSSADTSAGAARPYAGLRSAAPRFWTPTWLESDVGDFFGAGTAGRDPVGRHAWFLSLALHPGSGRTAGGAGYTYLGIPPMGALKPALGIRAARDWDRIRQPVHADSPYVDEREDVVAAQLTVSHARWRSRAALAAGAELVVRSRVLGNAPDLRLRDEQDRLYGARVTGTFGNARSWPFSISAEDGVSLQVTARQRWDTSPTHFTDAQGTAVTLDAGYRELSTWNAAYRSLGRRGFANAVLAVRASALLRDGPGAEPYGVGGSSGGGLGIDIVDTGSEFLPVRGYDADTRIGTRAWSSSAELRVPVALIAARARPLPLFLHALSLAAFADAGDASCPTSLRCGPRASGPALTSAGAEAVLDAEVLGLRADFRFGAAFPLTASLDRSPRLYLQLGSAF